jgi:hypothetical protein
MCIFVKEAYTMKAKRILKTKEPISPNLMKLIGIVKLPVDFDEKRELRDSLEEKHFKRNEWP